MIRCKQLCPRCFLFWKNDEFILYASRVDCVCVKYDVIHYAAGFGMYSDKKPSPFLLPLGMFSSMLGMIGLAFAPNFIIVIISVLFIGLGSAVFHPEGARVAYMAAGAKRGLAQAIYQVGGNTGNSLAPIFTALIFVPLGQIGSLGFTAFAAVGIVLLIFVSNWYKNELATGAVRRKRGLRLRQKMQL